MSTTSEYADPLSRHSLNSLRKELEAMIDKHHDWYTGNQRFSRFLGTVVPLCALMLFGFSLIYPVYYGVFGGEEREVVGQDYRLDGYVWGHLAVVAAGVVLLFDTHFLFSKNWVRRSKVAKEIETAKDELRMDWATIELKFKGDVVDLAVASEAVQLLKSVLSEVNEMVLLETGKWGEDVIASRAALTDRINKRTKLAEQKINELQKAKDQLQKSKEPGLLQIEFVNADRAQGAVTVEIGEQAIKFEVIPENHIFEGLSPGTRVLKATWMVAENKSIIESFAVIVKPAEVQKQEIDLNK